MLAGEEGSDKGVTGRSLEFLRETTAQAECVPASSGVEANRAGSSGPPAQGDLAQSCKRLESASAKL